MFLESVRVVDIGSYVAAPAAATVMGDFGADVVKVEPIDGDPYRRLLGILTTEYPNFFWDLDSRNKKSLAIDVTSEDGREVLEKLISEADVGGSNYRPDLLTRLRLTYDDVQAINPKIIYGQVNSFGLEGPDADRTGFDATAYWARSGLMDYVRGAGAEPAVSAPGLGDHPTSMSLFGGIMGALYRREKTGQGAHVHTSLLANGAWGHSMVIQGALVGFDTTQIRTPEDVKMIPLATTYRTADDRVLLMCILNPDKEWAGFMRALDAPSLADDPRFADTPTRMMNGAALYDALEEVFKTRTAAEWCERLDAEQITYQLTQTLSEVVNDDQMHANDILTPMSEGKQLYAHVVNSPVWIADDEKRLPVAAPEVGQHTREVLEDLGFESAAIERLVATGVAKQADVDD